MLIQLIQTVISEKTKQDPFAIFDAYFTCIYAPRNNTRVLAGLVFGYVSFFRVFQTRGSASYARPASRVFLHVYFQTLLTHTRTKDMAIIGFKKKSGHLNPKRKLCDSRKFCIHTDNK